MFANTFRPLYSLLVLTFASYLLVGCHNSTSEPTAAGTVTPPPTALVADSDRTAFAGQTVTLIGYAGGATDASFEWKQIGGAKVTLLNADSANASFVAPTITGSAHELLSFKLIVSNANGSSDSKVAIAVQPVANVIVHATAKALKANAGDTVSLHAIGSGAATGAYRWSQLSPATPAITLASATTANPSFTAPDIDNVTFRFQVTYSDSTTGQSATDVADVLVSRASTQITAKPLTAVGASSSASVPQSLKLLATPQSTVVGGEATRLTLAVTGGTQPYTWAWAQSGGTAATLSGTTNAVLDLIAPGVTTPQTLTFGVTVTDAKGAIQTGTAYMRVVPPPQPSSGAVPPTPTVRDPLLTTGGTAVTFYVPLQNPVVFQTGGPVAQVVVQSPLQSSPTQSFAVIVTPPQITGNTAPAEFTVTGTDATGQTVQIVQPVVILRAPSQAPPTLAPPVVTPDAPKFVALAPGLAVDPAKPPTLTVAVPTLYEKLEVKNCGAGQADEGQAGIVVGVCATGGTGQYSYSWTQATTAGAPTLTLRDATTSHPSFDAPVVDIDRSILFFATVQSGGQTVRKPVLVRINNISPDAHLTLFPLSGMTVQSGQQVSLNPPLVQGGVPPYVWVWTQRAGTSVGTLSGGNPTFSAPTLAPGAADETLTFHYQVTDSYLDSTGFNQNVIVKTQTPLAATLTGPSSADQGTTISLNTNVTGGVAPYTYSYDVTPKSVTIRPTANPSFRLPGIATGQSSIDLDIAVTVTDSNTPPHNAFSPVHRLTVAAPQAAPGAVQARAAEATLTQTLVGVTNSADALAKTLAAAANLPKDVLTAAVPAQETPQVLATKTAMASQGCPVSDDDFKGACEDAYGGSCAADFYGMYSGPGVVCYVVGVCRKSAGLCEGVTPAMKQLLDESLRRTSYVNAHPECFYNEGTNCQYYIYPSRAAAP